MAWHLHSPLRRLAACILTACLLAPLAPGQEAAPTTPPDVAAFLDRIEAAWQTHDVEAWLALRELSGPEERAVEEATLRAVFASDEAVLTFLRRPTPGPDESKFVAEVQVFTAKEPKARVLFWTLLAERRPAGWVVVSRQEVGQMDGLVHLAHAPQAYRVRDFALHFKDFEIRFEDGTLFSTPDEVGPTLVTFVGRARVRFTPSPTAEREQLRQFSGSTALDRAVDWAFVRMHPMDFLRAKAEHVFEPEPDPGARRAKADKIFRDRAERSFIVDAPLPRSPWWLMPGVGDAVVDFPFGRKRVLTFALTSSEVEDVNLFDRDRRLQICTYPSSGEVPRYSEDDDRGVDVLEHDITARLDPDRFGISATHRMWVRLVAPAATLRLRLADDFSVSSVQSGDGGNLLFFRVRDQGTLVVSLGPLASREEPFTLVTRYSGRHDPAPVDEELVQVGRPSVEGIEDVFVDRPPIVYSNRTAWYPRPPNEDFATARIGFDTPEGWLAVTGGELVRVQGVAGRTLTEYRLAEPGKFLTAIVGKLTDVGMRQEGPQTVRGFAGPRTRRETLDEMGEAQQMLAFYARKFGPSPYPTLGLVVAEGETPAGHSPPGLLYLQLRPPILRGRALPQDPANFSDLPGFFLAHEVAHQWWGQGVAPANYRERWLSEAWAQYAAALWLRERLGERAFYSMMDRMASWAFRHDDAGPIHLGQRLGHLKQQPRYFRAVVYDKGAWVLHMLRGLIGDEAFFTGARTFLERHRYAKAGTEDLRTALEAASGQDLAPYFARWVYETGLPAVTWTATSVGVAGGFRTTVALRPSRFPGPLPLQISVVTSAGTEQRAIRLAPEGGSVTIDTREAPRRLALNEDRGLLAQIARTPGPAQR
jgi:Peptidase family M1 domain